MKLPVFSLSNAWALAFLLAVAFVATMALHSKINSHPDEIHHITAAQYYLDHWHPPAVGDPATLNSYSKYGMSYLNEREIVYFFAGKFARVLTWWDISWVQAVRLFNLVQIAGLGLVFLLKPSTRWALGLCLMSPQIWYVYSYFNGDAFPLTVGLGLALSFGTVTQTLSSGKLREKSPKQLAAIALFVMGLIILAISKRNYQAMLSFFMAATAYRVIGREAGLAFLLGSWVLALLSFPSALNVNIRCLAMAAGAVSLVLLFRLYRRRIKPIGDTPGFVLRVLALSAILGLTGAAPSAFETLRPAPVAGLTTGDMVSKTAREAFKPTPSGTTSFYGMGLRDKGVSFYEIMLSPWNWAELMAKSASGLYGWMNIRAPEWLYLALWCSYAVLGIGAVRACVLVPNPDTRDLALMALLCSGGLIAASAYSSWVADFQAQGRYLFPIIPMIATLAPAIAGRMNSRWCLIGGISAFALSSFSFAYVGITSIVKLGT